MNKEMTFPEARALITSERSDATPTELKAQLRQQIIARSGEMLDALQQEKNRTRLASLWGGIMTLGSVIGSVIVAHFSPGNATTLGDWVDGGLLFGGIAKMNNAGTRREQVNEMVKYVQEVKGN